LKWGQGDEAQKFKLEVDYWVNGRLSEYEQQLNQLESELKAGESKLTTEQVQELGEQIIALQPILGEIVEQAKLTILGSQLRVEIADKVVGALESLGYTLVDSESDAVYEGNDQRNAFVVKVKNIAGDEVVTVISPEKEFGANSVSINTFSQTLVDETATRQNAKAIFDALEEEGVQGDGEPVCNQKAQQEYQNLEEVKRRQVASPPSPRVSKNQ
jgi:P pilus assembly protein, porin PapC